MSVPFTVTRLCSDFSLEITPRQARSIGRFTDHLQPATSVDLTYRIGSPFSETVEAARRLAADPMRPVPGPVGNTVKMATPSTYPPDRTMLGVARAAVADRTTLFRGYHFFRFGSYSRTACWARAIGEGQFRIDPCTDRLEVQE